uniref:Uncharacterized protein n=1 Tax=Candidatus Methanogaster sp. ANME-2c ERB4 TaxID=2759911 RepID=A0A7G9Y3U6_9EURY|nr:hypothetical protein MPGNBCFJ_00010 [Methanosarcinales archaeon ANME-2c ERB4]QNO42060.1 hypothetical protein NIICAKKE_00010 [Methanosarcinales archaeon ANME-2c ERB4]QNO42293.1 hypothetical protein OEDCDHIP_00010 [Methanosarcinales archaeon ANME-2c ERB4]QNO42452.1 hypothetical protein LBOOMNCC_00005 [Methanosarcinales archaeon ANME-2c ERB4]QNO42680.1 hypothetical protein GKPKHNMI_00002 [Methanosarcinales archaeon ANME-2c ERB4]
MPYPYLEAYTKHATGADRGDYTHIPCPLRNISTAHNAAEIHHSLFEGDRMTFHQILTSRNDELDRERPIRFYNKDPADGGIKLFDGIIINTKYTYVGNDYLALKVDAVGWWRELARFDLHTPIEYDDNWCVNDIYLDLVQRANSMGMMKEAIYEYDTAKIPEYGSPHDIYFTSNTGTAFTFNNIYEGMKTLTKYLDSVTPGAYEFGLRIEALPRLDGITQSNVGDSIYILPFPLNQDKSADAIFKRFQLATGYDVQRDYRRLANQCKAIGSGVETQQIRTSPILATADITSSDEYYAPTNQPLASHYLRVTITNPESIPESGTVAITFEITHTPDPSTYITDYLRFSLPKAIDGHGVASQIQYTSIRSQDGIRPAPNTDIHVTGFGGWAPALTITIEEVSNDTYPSPYDTIFTTSIAGRSINDYGYAGKTISAMWLTNTDADVAQRMVDYIAGKHCRLYQAPTHALYAPVLPSYVSYDNLIGNVAEFYTPYEASLDKFLITDAVYGFKGKVVTQHLLGMRYETEWDYEDTYIYVMVGSDFVMVGTENVVI